MGRLYAEARDRDAADAGIYSGAMDATGPTLLRRALAVLQAKQYLLFYAIPLYALSAVVPLLLSWMHAEGSPDDVLGRPASAVYDVAAAPGLLAIAVVLVYLAVYTWFRAGFIRSIVGRFHLRPQSGGQFFSLLGVYATVEIVFGLGAWALVATTDAGAVVGLIGVVLLVAGVVLMYADYASVITGLDPVRAIVRSWACVRANLAISVMVALTVYLVAALAGTLLSLATDEGWLQAVPLLVIYVLVMGVVTFAADVVMVVTYVHAVETGRLPRAR
jgi:hypothetical protein